MAFKIGNIFKKAAEVGAKWIGTKIGGPVGGNFADTYLGKVTVDYYDNDTSSYTLGHTSKEMYDTFRRAGGGDARGGKLTNIMTSTSEDSIKNATNIKVYLEVKETVGDDTITKYSNTWVVFEVFT